MARKKKDEEPAAPEPQPTGNWFTRALYRPRVLFVVALGLMSTALVPLVYDRLPDLKARDEFQIRTAQIQVEDAPRWVPDNLLEQVIDGARLPETLSLLEPGLSERLARAFVGHPWVLDAEVQITQSEGIVVKPICRRPVAMVEVKRGMYPVDAQGVLLPPADFSLSDTQRFPHIKNVSTNPSGPAGTVWRDLAVVAGARLAAVLWTDENDSAWKRLKLKSISAKPLEKSDATLDDLVLELETGGRSRIIWGRTPGSDYPGELTYEQKVGKIFDYLTKYGDFDQPYEIDIRHWHETTRQRLSATPRPRN